MGSRRSRSKVALLTTGLLTTTMGVGVGSALADPGDGSGAVGNDKVVNRGLAKTPSSNKSEIGRSGTDLGPGEIGRSKNMKHLANVRPDGPLATDTGTDIAFQDDKAFVGNYSGFSIWDIKTPSKPRKIAQVSCPGSQNDISVSGDRLYLSTDVARSDDSCASTGGSGTDKASWEGIKIFDISDLKKPRYVQAVETACGSHTHTLVPGGKSKEYLYVSSYSPSKSLPDCQPPHDSISIIEVPKKRPAAAKVVAEPNLFPDGGTESPDLLAGGTSGCHDITVYPAKNLAAGACMGDGIIMSIADPKNPKVIERVSDRNFDFWHSATFTNDGSKVLFTDELGGGNTATCDETTAPFRGANAIYNLNGRNKLKFQSYFKIDRHQHPSENCVSHNGSLIPVKGKNIMVQSWYMGGTNVWDFTNPTKPREIGYFERGPEKVKGDGGGTWSSYYYNGHIYSSDLGMGLDVLKITGKDFKSAAKVKMGEFNPQSQPFIQNR
ncbi:LVIVD repeat-containing protein [Demetria terragena]|uniref:LVIVD repeat-containing protein n=1 Tax=Demetria terragena TaxID=63959 RepID=UPI00037E2052|nr:hypothetical protein [Demetria terragena]